MISVLNCFMVTYVGAARLLDVDSTERVRSFATTAPDPQQNRTPQVEQVLRPSSVGPTGTLIGAGLDLII